MVLNFREWFEARRPATVHPELKKWLDSADKLKQTIEKLKAVLKDKEDKKKDIKPVKVEKKPEKEQPQKPDIKKPEVKKPDIKPDIKKPEIRKKPEPKDIENIRKKAIEIRKKPEPKDIENIRKKAIEIRKKPEPKDIRKVKGKNDFKESQEPMFRSLTPRPNLPAAIPASQLIQHFLKLNNKWFVDPNSMLYGKTELCHKALNYFILHHDEPPEMENEEGIVHCVQKFAEYMKSFANI